MDTARAILWQQMAAALEMLENAVLACPERLWSRPSSEMGFWFMVYHTLYYLDHDLTPMGQAFASPAFDVHEYERRALAPPYRDPYSMADLAPYLSQCREKCKATIESFAAGDRGLRGCERIDAEVEELLLYHLRHVQHHAAQLNLLLRQATDGAPRWVRRVE